MWPLDAMGVVLDAGGPAAYAAVTTAVAPTPKQHTSLITRTTAAPRPSLALADYVGGGGRSSPYLLPAVTAQRRTALPTIADVTAARPTLPGTSGAGPGVGAFVERLRNWGMQVDVRNPHLRGLLTGVETGDRSGHVTDFALSVPPGPLPTPIVAAANAAPGAGVSCPWAVPWITRGDRHEQEVYARAVQDFVDRNEPILPGRGGSLAWYTVRGVAGATLTEVQTPAWLALGPATATLVRTFVYTPGGPGSASAVRVYLASGPSVRLVYPLAGPESWPALGPVASVVMDVLTVVVGVVITIASYGVAAGIVAAGTAAGGLALIAGLGAGALVRLCANWLTEQIDSANVYRTLNDTDREAAISWTRSFVALANSDAARLGA